ncbi:hypothetical protein DITRI_Ditri16bG0057300 [Diplodiscus trichospermus]
MTHNFSFTQKVAYCGFNPPQNHDQIIQNKIANDQRQETPFLNMGYDGNGFKTNGLKQEKSGKNEPKKARLESENHKCTFWTVCPYCYCMYEYEKKYEECCLLCQNCRKGFHGLPVVAPPERLLVDGKGEYYSGYGFFPLGYSGNSFLGDKKEVDREDTGKKRNVVEIADSSDDEEMETDVKNEAGKEKAEGLSNGKVRGVMKRVKSVRMNTKKMMGRGVKRTIEKVNVMETTVEYEKGVADINCGSSEGIKLGSGSDQNGHCFEDDLEFFEGNDDIFVGLRDILDGSQ